MNKTNVKPATGKLGVMVVGLGAVTTTFMTGVLMARKGLAKPVGSMTQYDRIRVGQGSRQEIPQIQRNRAHRIARRHRIRSMGRISCQCLRIGHKRRSAERKRHQPRPRRA